MQTERRGTRYEDDFARWADEQAAALAEGRVADLDLVPEQPSAALLAALRAQLQEAGIRLD